MQSEKEQGFSPGYYPGVVKDADGVVEPHQTAKEEPGAGLPGADIPFDPTGHQSLEQTLDSKAFQDAVDQQHQPPPQPIHFATPMDRASSAVTSENLLNKFTYHPPKGDQQQRYVALRRKALEFAELALAVTPRSPEQTLGIRRIEEAVFWLNAAIARNE